MTDIVDAAARSRIMAAVRQKNTKPEIVLRRLLHRAGFRFRLHRRDLPGRPDLVLPKHRAAVFVHGCFWHRHPRCRRASTPKTRPEFWEAKFVANVARDLRAIKALEAGGWRVFVVWECGLVADPTGLVELLADALLDQRSRRRTFPARPPYAVGD